MARRFWKSSARRDTAGRSAGLCKKTLSGYLIGAKLISVLLRNRPTAVHMPMTCNRRQFLRNTAVFGAGLYLPGYAGAALMAVPERSLRFYNTHTGESLKTVFWADGDFVPEALSDINKLLRDYRTNDVSPIDPQLLILLDRVTTLVSPGDALHVISGYRSPKTNQYLADQSDGVAKHSLHLEGKAIDIRIPGRDLTQLRDSALSLKGGGVGFYPKSQFVHMDTGRVRRW